MSGKSIVLRRLDGNPQRVYEAGISEASRVGNFRLHDRESNTP